MTQWLPLFSSLVVAFVVLVGVLITNRTNRRAIDAADERGSIALEAAQRNVEAVNAAAEQRSMSVLEAAQRNTEAAEQREHEKWRRESVLAAVTTLLATSASVRQQLSSQDFTYLGEIDRFGLDLHESIGQCAGSVTRLRILSGPRIPNRCEDLLRTLTAAANITVQKLTLTLDGEATVDDLDDIRTLWHKAIASTVEQELSVVKAARAELGLDPLPTPERSPAASAV
ncbi:hypothetical protein [Nocardia lijiangensis]|uniref:hypothetical protein n=1 Tax=Nocardia lijiangensis TaxID=299618 RepID=UPI00082CC47D|nr:hypothetical protein [Nocardia lijiangensis]